MPGHDGVRGNERGERHAGMAAVEIGRAMDRVDILNAIREAEWEKDANTNYQSEGVFLGKSTVQAAKGVSDITESWESSVTT